jgi:hypothetical protein
MKEFVATLAIVSVVATPVIADPISQHRAAAIEKCSQQANALYGPSGGHDWRRFDHDYYASCMADQGEPE